MSPVEGARRIVVKVGSSLLVDDTGRLRRQWLASLAEDVRAIDAEFLVVSSGAIALGRRRLGLSGSLTLAQKQACAAAGQSELTRGYERAFGDRVTAQALLTLNDTEVRRRWLNARATLETLIACGAFPIINENDTVATSEIRYGDNDRLAARTAQMVGADLLVLLSDIDGLYTGDPRVTKDAQFIESVEELTPNILAMGGEPGSDHGTGGMATKLSAAQICMSAGCDMIIADGRAPHPLSRLASERHTRFRAPPQSPSARRQWIVGTLAPKGRVHIDQGAADALADDKSLLVAGVTRVEGEFEKGDAVDVVCGTALARGLASYSAEHARRIAGRQGGDIEGLLGYTNGPALIHRDNLVRLNP